MSRLSRTAAVLSMAITSLAGLPPAAVTAQQRTPAARLASAIRPEALWAPLRFLSDDLLEGRATGSRGGEIAATYIASQYMALGLEPAGDSGTYFHNVPIVTLNPSATLEVVDGAAPRSLRFREDFVAWSERSELPSSGARDASGRLTQEVGATGEIVFVGFGITATEYQWDDLGDTDLTGKIVMVLVNDPGLRNADIFRGRLLTYYGRWTYKLERAAERGAAAVLLVHDDVMATYGWNTVVNSWTGEQVRLLKPATSLAWAGWITRASAAALLREAGHDLDRLVDAANRRGFRPVATGITVRGTVRSAARGLTSANVAARLPGGDPALRDEVVMIGAHWDHMGIGRPVNGDSVMNGAIDNSSGVAVMLAIADAFVRTGVRPRRSVLFVAFTAEERGLLGSQAIAERPPVPLSGVAAILNVDGMNLYGRTNDVGALGRDHSSLGEVFAQAARAEGLRVASNEESDLRGGYFRSDHFPLARVGVPGLSIQGGSDFVGRPADWAREVREEYNRNRYHQPDDELLPWYTVDGALQQARVVARTALLVGDAATQPIWSATSEFSAAGERRRPRR